MDKRKLGKSLEVSAIGYGCMGLSHGYGIALEKKEAIQRIHSALDAGYTFFDTAEVYTGKFPDGTNSINEEIVGDALRPVRDKVVIATKCGIALDDSHNIHPNAKPEALRHSLEQSLRRMRIETIDLYYQHRTDPNVEPEVVAATMKDFIREGKIRCWGISNGSEEYVRRAHAVCPVTAVQLRYSMMARWNEKIFPLLEELDIGFVAFSPLANGYLSATHKAGEKYDGNLDYRSWMPQYTPEGIKQATPLLELLNRLAKEKQATPAQISLAWVLCKKPWIVPIPGSSKTERIFENAGAANIKLASSEMDEIDNLLAKSDFQVFGEQEKAK